MTEILDIAHDMALGLVKVGAIDKVTMHKIEALCLPQKSPLKHKGIKLIRRTNRIRQLRKESVRDESPKG